MYKCNIEVHSRNNSCCGKAIIITYYECVPSHSYPTCKVHALYYTYSVIFGLSDYTTFFHIISYMARFFKCFDFIYNFCLKYFSF